MALLVVALQAEEVPIFRTLAPCFSPLYVHQVTTVSSPSQVEFRPFECAESSGGLRFVMALLVVALPEEEVLILRNLPPCFSPLYVHQVTTISSPYQVDFCLF